MMESVKSGSERVAISNMGKRRMGLKRLRSKKNQTGEKRRKGNKLVVREENWPGKEGNT